MCDDISGGLERRPVSFVNELDDQDLPYFEEMITMVEAALAFRLYRKNLRGYHRTPINYTTCNVPGPGSEEREFCEAFPGCDCDPECGPRCVCISRSSRPLWPAVECSSLCGCDETCPNRKVQRGICFRLQVFKTTAKGFGVRTLEPIARGSYVCPYAGEAIGLQTARERVRALDPHEANYVMALQEGGRVVLVVDPSRVGGVGRFLNHSCDPNLEMVPVRAQCVVPELCLFARRDVAPGEELTYDYSGGSHSGGGRPCLCGAPACRGRLPLDVHVLGV